MAWLWTMCFAILCGLLCGQRSAPRESICCTHFACMYYVLLSSGGEKGYLLKDYLISVCISCAKCRMWCMCRFPPRNESSHQGTPQQSSANVRWGAWAIAVSAMRDVDHIEGARLAKCGLTPFLFFATIKIQKAQAQAKQFRDIKTGAGCWHRLVQLMVSVIEPLSPLQEPKQYLKSKKWTDMWTGAAQLFWILLVRFPYLRKCRGFARGQPHTHTHAHMHTRTRTHTNVNDCEVI